MQKKHSIRKFLNGRGYYIVLAACVVAVGISGLIFYRTIRSTTEPTEPAEPTASLSVPATTQPAESPTPPAKKETEQPSVASPTVPAVSLEIEPEPVICQPLAEGPLAGETLAAFSADALAYNATMADWRTHNGVDISAALGADVRAVMDGVVTAVYDDDYLGTVVTIEHDNGWRTLYANLTAAPDVSAGDTVQAGQIIGAVGQTAMLEVASQPHLHLEVYRNGELTDPDQLLNQG